jgi:Preprotein translocase SecG subunit
MLLSILLTIHIIVCIALILVILMQRSEGGALGMGGGGGGGGIMSARHGRPVEPHHLDLGHYLLRPERTADHLGRP